MCECWRFRCEFVQSCSSMRDLPFIQLVRLQRCFVREKTAFLENETHSILFSRKSSAVWRFPGGHLQVGAYGSDPIEDKCLQTLALWPVPIPGRRPLIGFQIARAQAPFQREARGEGSFIFQLGCVHSKGYQASQNFDEKLIFLS